jgi:pyridoxal 5'-phosphate synthase pdxT subunit
MQGAFERHAQVMRALGHQVILIRSAADFEGLEGLVLPGGESTAQWKLLQRLGLERQLCAIVRAGRPLLATCAGMILAARRVREPVQDSLALVDMTVERNAWGRQVDSFEATSDGGLPLVFIRAPRVAEFGPAVEVLDTFRGEPVLLREGNATCATFHPELTDDPRVHERVFGKA